MLDRIVKTAQKVRAEYVGSESFNKCWDASWKIKNKLNDMPNLNVVSGIFLVEESECQERPHYWLEWENHIIDVTADQFNGFISKRLPPVFIADIDSVYYIKSRYCVAEDENVY